MARELALCIVLEKPPAGVDFALQKGRGSEAEAVQKQRSEGNDLRFEFRVALKEDDGSRALDFGGPFVQGPRGERFVYIGIGTHAGQADSCWSRRLKIPLRGIQKESIEQEGVLEARVSGTGSDGTPACASVRAFTGWKAAGR